MGNHVHICLYHEDIRKLSKFMHIVNSKFASYYNYLENRVGYVFRSRFFSQEIIDRQQLYNVVAYIHNNPKKAKLVDKLEDYKYSSYKDYIKNKIDKDIIFLVFQTIEYKNIFYFIHRNYKALEVKDVMEENECSYEEIIDDFIKKNKVSMNIIKRENNFLLELIKILKLETRITNKKISEILGINKNKVTKINRKILE